MNHKKICIFILEKKIFLANLTELLKNVLLQIISVKPCNEHKVAFCMHIKTGLNVFLCYNDHDDKLLLLTKEVKLMLTTNKSVCVQS